MNYNLDVVVAKGYREVDPLTDMWSIAECHIQIYKAQAMIRILRAQLDDTGRKLESALRHGGYIALEDLPHY